MARIWIHVECGQNVFPYLSQIFQTYYRQKVTAQKTQKIRKERSGLFTCKLITWGEMRRYHVVQSFFYFHTF